MVKRSAKIIRWLTGLGLVLFILLAAVLWISPYGTQPGHDVKRISTSIVINAPADSVFHYLGNSDNASKWSTFVNHIIPLNSEKFKDGVPGSTRRCFCNPDKTGTRWDELITEVVPGKKRQLIIYNMQDFPMTADGLATEQLYQKIDQKTTKLTFTLFFRNHEPTILEMIKMHIASFKVNIIFEANLKNIKMQVENAYAVQNP